MNSSEIIEQIKIGLTKGYNQNLLLLSSSSYFIEQVREYLLTVNVAQQLLEWNKYHNYKIQLEYPILQFYNNAFLSHDLDVTDIFNMVLLQRQTGHSPTNKLNQKIDIAITREETDFQAFSQDRTICGIELKAINKTDNEIINDAKRMGSAMTLTDNISSNSIQYCFCGFLRRFDKCEELVTDIFIKTKIIQEQNRWDSICTNLSIEFSTLNFSVEKFDVVNTSLELIADIHNKMGSDFSEVANATGIIVGYILSINRK
ncbi:hypothetical protein NYQ10_14925 [Flavobacterium johnsoniae]|uniref:hypothetical protein n=1 Tax=Flavobacterium johnsoniae TaxID=986 RepID=UPI0025B1EBD7|nr:hypothetical protein [Flavobacterium johnsoniae]WJS93385.1 hypothetical protein NYQ10_14925 [Flavobacterium johnsoniae]